MGATYLTVKFCRTDKPEICKTVRKVLVDTGSEISAIPADVAKELGIDFPRRERFELGDGKIKTGPVGSAVLKFGGQSVTDDVAPGPATLGVTALEKLGLTVDPKTKTLRKNGKRALLRR